MENNETRFPYQVNTIMPITGLSIGNLLVPRTEKLTKEDVLICIKKAPVFRRFSDGTKERVGIANLDRLHNEVHMTEEEYKEFLANSVVEEKVEEKIVEEEPVIEDKVEVAPIVEEEPVVNNESIETEVETVEDFIPEALPTIEDEVNETEETTEVVEENNDNNVD